MLIMARPLAQADANTMSVLTHTTTVSVLMPTVSVGCGSAGTSNYARTWSRRPSGKRCVDSLSIQNVWNGNIDVACCKKNRPQTNLAVWKHGWDACGKVLPG